MTTKKVFVSMPMAGKSREEIESVQEYTFKSVSASLEKESVELINSYLADTDELPPLECLAESLKLMARADYVVFVDGWENARGCKVERLCAEQYGLEIIDVKSIDLEGGDNDGE